MVKKPEEIIQGVGIVYSDRVIDVVMWRNKQAGEERDYFS